METIFWSLATTPWTRLLIASSARGLVRVHFVSEAHGSEAVRKLAAAFPQEQLVESSEVNRQVTYELQAYATGELKHFTVALDLRGTPFQMEVWRALKEISYGETRTYGEIARATNRPKAYRAVGLANHSNPVAIIVPCHRVIGSDGRLVGYGGGLELKITLIEHERRNSRQVFPSSSLPLWK